MRLLALFPLAIIFVSAYGITKDSQIEMSAEFRPKATECVVEMGKNGELVTTCKCYTSKCNHPTNIDKLFPEGTKIENVLKSGIRMDYTKIGKGTTKCDLKMKNGLQFECSCYEDKCNGNTGKFEEGVSMTSNLDNIPGASGTTECVFTNKNKLTFDCKCNSADCNGTILKYLQDGHTLRFVGKI